MVNGMDFLIITARIRVPLSDLQFRFSRSGGPGGQNVNRLSTRVELIFDLERSSLDNAAKETARRYFSSRLDSSGSLRIVCQESRSQWQNKRTAIEKLETLLKKAFRPVRPRKATSATHSSVEKRLKEKKVRGDSKRLRRKRVDSESE